MVKERYIYVAVAIYPGLLTRIVVASMYSRRFWRIAPGYKVYTEFIVA
jgi:hypothetical protein